VIPYAISFILDFHNMVIQRNLERPELVLPRYSDFGIAFNWIAVFLVLRYICSNYIFNNLGNLVIDGQKWTAEEREAKSLRFGHCFFKFIWFCCISTFSLYILRHREWVPPILGGTGSTQKCNYENYPWFEVDEDLRNYYMIQFAYHSHSLIYQFTLIKRGDFLEMLLHHVVTISLISFSYLNNYMQYGTLVLLVHDIPDIFTYLIKIAVDTQHRMLNVVCFYLLVFSWGIGRLFIFPFVLIYSTIFEASPHVYGYTFFNLFLLSLLCLHIYWYYLFVKIGMRFYDKSTKGQIGDAIEDGKVKNLNENKHPSSQNSLK